METIASLWKNGHRALIFDMDGVILDSESIWRSVSLSLLQNEGIEVSEAQLYPYMGIAAPHAFDKIKSDFGLKVSKESFIQAQYHQVSSKIREGISSHHGFETLVAQAKNIGFHLGICSTSPKIVVESVVETLGLHQYFNIITALEQVFYPKPNPECYLKTMAFFNTKPFETIIIEDSFSGLSAARNSGAYTIGLRHPEYSVPGFDVLTHQGISSLNDLVSV